MGCLCNYCVVVVIVVLVVVVVIADERDCLSKNGMNGGSGVC